MVAYANYFKKANPGGKIASRTSPFAPGECHLAADSTDHHHCHTILPIRSAV